MTIRKRTLYWILAAIFAFTAIYAPFSDNKDSSILVTILTILLFIALAILFAHLARKVDPEKTIRFGKAKTMAKAASANGLPHDYTCIDIETTGLPDQDPRIIELGAVRIRNGKVSGTYSQLVNPGKPIPAKVSELTGIYDSLVADSPTIAQALPSFVEFCGTDTLVGHNIDRFDAPIIQAEAQRNNIQLPDFNTIDTLPLAETLCHELDRHRVVDLIRAFDIGDTEDHRATQDALQTSQIYEELRRRAS